MTEHLECPITKTTCPSPNSECARCGVYLMDDMMKFMGLTATFVTVDKDDVL